MNGNTEQLRVGIFGGTFSPVHNGHIASAKAFMEQMKLDYLYVIPTCQPPHKQIDPSDNPRHRLRMCELAFKDIDGVIVSDMEIKRGGRSYTYDTVKDLSGPNVRLFLMCGTDMVLSFDRWYRFEDILKLCYPVYVRREDDPIMSQRVVAKINEYYEKYGVMFRRIITDPIDISSTLVRQKLSEAKDVSDLIPKAVEDYIKDNRLYELGDRGKYFHSYQLSDLLFRVSLKLSRYRFQHTSSVTDTAYKLAKLYLPGYSSELQIAAILHDITKELSVEEHIELMKKHGVAFTDADIEAEPLLHSKTAELMIRDEFPGFETEKVCQAVRYHTTGNPNMTLFDAIIYIADYIEDTRTNDFCVKLREYFWAAGPLEMECVTRVEHLWKTVLYSLDMTVENITGKGGKVDPITLATREAVRNRLKIES